MKVLTLTQPWASLVCIGAKRIETRGWNTYYRGPLAIHAAKKITTEGLRMLFQYPATSYLTQRCGSFGLEASIRATLGHIIGVTYLSDVKQTGIAQPTRWVRDLSDKERAFGNYGPGRFGWMLHGAVLLDEPIPAKGRLGLWEFEHPALSEAAERLERLQDCGEKWDEEAV